jgi:hypothetical protein
MRVPGIRWPIMGSAVSLATPGVFGARAAGLRLPVPAGTPDLNPDRGDAAWHGRGGQPESRSKYIKSLPRRGVTLVDPGIAIGRFAQVRA